jgi:hypothetical protein
LPNYHKSRKKLVILSQILNCSNLFTVELKKYPKYFLKALLKIQVRWWDPYLPLLLMNCKIRKLSLTRNIFVLWKNANGQRENLLTMNFLLIVKVLQKVKIWTNTEVLRGGLDLKKCGLVAILSYIIELSNRMIFSKEI